VLQFGAPPQPVSLADQLSTFLRALNTTIAADTRGELWEGVAPLLASAVVRGRPAAQQLVHVLHR
jgi:hypothetical protein